MHKKTKILFIGMFVFLSLLVFSYSQASDVVQLDPAKIRLVIAPGDAKTGSINVYNQSPEAKDVKVYAQDWVYLPVCDGTKDFKPAGTTELSAGSWISFVPSEFMIPAFGKKAINYSVRVPSDVNGGHYAVLFFENYLGEQKTPAEGVNVNLAVRVASLFYIEPKGTIERKAKIDNLKISKAKDKFYITADFTNTGNVDITARANFFIIDKKGVPYARGEFNEVYTFSKNVAVLSSSWKDKIPKGKYDLILTVDISRVLREAGLPEEPAITKEAQIEIGDDGEIVNVSGLN